MFCVREPPPRHQSECARSHSSHAKQGPRIASSVACCVLFTPSDTPLQASLGLKIDCKDSPSPRNVASSQPTPPISQAQVHYPAISLLLVRPAL